MSDVLFLLLLINCNHTFKSKGTELPNMQIKVRSTTRAGPYVPTLGSKRSPDESALGSKAAGI